MELTFVENLFIAWIIFFALFALYGLINLLGLGVVKVWGRKKRKYKRYVAGRVL